MAAKKKKTTKPEPELATVEDVPDTLVPPPAPPPAPTPNAGTFPVLELSKKTGNRLKGSRHNPNRIFGPNSSHAAADAMHGWSDYQHHYAKPVQLTESDYLAALEAAVQFKTHSPALAPHKR